MLELKEGVKRYMDFYNRKRFHQSLDYLTLDQAYYRGSRLSLTDILLGQRESRVVKIHPIF